MAVEQSFGNSEQMASGMGIGTFTVPVYGLYIETNLKQGSTPPLFKNACIYNQTADTATNVSKRFTIQGDGSFVAVSIKGTLLPSQLMADIDQLPSGGEYYQISSADYAEIDAFIGL